MSRIIFALAFLLMASNVSAQANYNAYLFTNSDNCGTTNVTTDNLALHNLTLATTEGANKCNTFTADNTTQVLFYAQAICNSTTGVLQYIIANDANCASVNQTFYSLPAAPKCNSIDANTTLSVPNCAIGTTTAPPTNGTTTAPPTNGTTTAPPTNGTTTAPPTNGTTTAPPTNGTTTAPPTNGTTTAPPTGAPTTPTNQTTPKPGVAAQAGASFSMLIAAAAVILAALL